MRGGTERRHCELCDKAVHNLSEMAPEVAAELLERPEPVCVRIRCSADGTVLHSAPSGRIAAHPRLQLLMTPALLAAMAACRAPTDDLPLVVEGPPASESLAPVVSPAAPAPAVETGPVASANQRANLERQPPMPSHFLTGVTGVLDDQPSPIAPKPVHEPRPAKATRAAAPNAPGAAENPEHPRPDWIIECDRQPGQERDTKLECTGFCI